MASILLAIAGVLALAIAASLGFVALRRRAVARTLALPPAGINEQGYVRIGGVDQWVQIRGTDRSNPVLLWLHPHGASMIPLTPLHLAWEQHFTVVHWDRRTVGRTRRAPNHGTEADWTFDRFITDGIELVEHLQKRLGVDQVTLAAHSQGTVVGLGMARRRPDLIRAYVGMGQMADMARNTSIVYDRVLAATRAAGRRSVTGKLVQLGPPPYSDRIGWMRLLQYTMEVDAEAKAWRNVSIIRTLLTPGYSVRDILGWFSDVMAFPQHLYEETVAVTPDTLGTTFEVPILVLQGADDGFAIPDLARQYVDSIEAPAKAYVAQEGLGHLAPFLFPDRILSAFTALVRREESRG
jgi:proline iminopeptidase